MTADLFQTETADRQVCPTSPTAVPERQFVRNPCECGAGGGWRMVGHYDVVRCSCGKYFWMLQPRRNGPFVAFAWPGLFPNDSNASQPDHTTKP